MNDGHSSLTKSAGQVRAGLEQHDVDALLAELVRERAAAGAGADDHDDLGVVDLEAIGDGRRAALLMTPPPVRQPVEIVEPPVDVAALVEGRALVAEQRPGPLVE